MGKILLNISDQALLLSSLVEEKISFYPKKVGGGGQPFVVLQPLAVLYILKMVKAVESFKQSLNTAISF